MTLSPLPTVSVIVPVLDGLADLQLCIRALLNQDYPAELVEIIVADNGSKVPPGDHLPQEPRLVVLTETSPGSYTARNTALGKAVGEIIAFTDADCQPQPDWIRRSVEALGADPPADLVGGAIDLFFNAGRPVSGSEWYEQLHGFPQEQYVQRGFAVTANLTTRRSVIDRVGAFDATLASGGDAEWGRRVRASGGTLRWAPAARVSHPARATGQQLLRKSRRTAEGVATKALRQPGGRRRLVRMMLGHVRGVVMLTFTVWRAAEPSTPRARLAYLGMSCANSGTVVSVLLRSLIRGR